MGVGTGQRYQMTHGVQIVCCVLAFSGSTCIARADDTCSSLNTPRAVTVLENVCSALLDVQAGSNANMNQQDREMLRARGQFLDRVSEMHMQQTFVDLEHMREIHSKLVSSWATNQPEFQRAFHNLTGTCERLLTADVSSGTVSASQVQRAVCGTR